MMARRLGNLNTLRLEPLSSPLHERFSKALVLRVKVLLVWQEGTKGKMGTPTPKRVRTLTRQPANKSQTAAKRRART